MSQMERILYIDRTLRNSGSITVQKVAEKYEVSTRQVKRDIEYMRDRFEAPIQWVGAERHYVYSESFKSLEFADQHLVLAYLSIQSLLQNSNYFPAISEQILTSFTSQIPSEYIEASKKIKYQVPAADSLDPEFFAGICLSLKNKVCLEIEYLNTRNESKERRIEPFNLINYAGNWYIIAWDHLRQGLRTFHASRIQKLAVTNVPFADHGKNIDSEVEKYIASGYGIFLGDKTQTVKIKFTGKAAQIVRTQTWHPSQQRIQNENGDVELSFEAANLTEVLSKVLSFGSYATPLEPKELVELWNDEIKKLSSCL